MQRVELVLPDRREPWIVERRAVSVVRDVGRERACRPKAADASAQAAVRLQRHERRTVLAQRRRKPVEIHGALLSVRESVTDRAHRDPEQAPPRLGVECPAAGYTGVESGGAGRSGFRRLETGHFRAGCSGPGRPGTGFAGVRRFGIPRPGAGGRRSGAGCLGAGLPGPGRPGTGFAGAGRFGIPRPGAVRLGRGLEKGIGAVADDTVARPRGVAGVPHVENARLETAALREMEQAVHRMAPAGLFVPDVVVAQRHDRLRRLRIEAARALVVEEMAQVRADDDPGLRPAPQRFEQGVDLGRARVADEQRRHDEPREHPEQERKVDFKTVLALERRIAPADERELQGPANRRDVDRHGAERRFERLGAGHRHAADRVVVHRAEQDDPADLPRPRLQPRVRTRGDRAGVAIPRVRSDQRLRRRPPGPRPPEAGIDLPAQRLAVARVERPRDVRRLHPRGGVAAESA